MTATAIKSAGTFLDGYARLLGAAHMSRIQASARNFQAARILHVSSTALRTHHVRLLMAAVDLMRELGIDVDVCVPESTPDDVLMAGALHEAIEGESHVWTARLESARNEYATRTASAIKRPYDCVVVHDPELVQLRRLASRRLAGRSRWIWHCHDDLSDCDPGVKRLLADEVSGFDGVAFEHRQFGGDLAVPDPSLIPPAIDALADRNITLRPTVTDEVFRRFDLSREHPIVVQVSGFDGWDDPQWAWTTFRLARRSVPNLQLVLVSTTPAGDEALEQLRPRIDRSYVRLLNTSEVNDIDINALQGAAIAAVQHGVRKGFSSALLEASWTGRPVLAGEGGALVEQVIDGTTGYVFTDFEDGAERMVQLVREPKVADAMGLAGHRLVRENHLVVRWVESYLRILAPAKLTVA